MLKITEEFLRHKLQLKLSSSILSLGIHTTKSEEHLTNFRTNDANPTNHKLEQIGQYYKMPSDIKKNLFAHGGLPKSFEEQSKTFTETCVMIRRPSLDIINCMKSINYEKPVVRFMLYGKKGSGKTLAMAHVIHYGLQSGFLVVHIPWVGNWMRRCKESSNSETKEGFINLNLDAAAWLLHFKTQNCNVLKNSEMRISKDYIWSKRESSLKDSTLLELIDHGINRVKYASDTIIALIEEVQILSNGGKCKTLVAIDGFNAFFYPNTRIFTEKKEIVHPAKVSITEPFLNLTKSNWKNGVAVITVDEIAIAEQDQTSHLP